MSEITQETGVENLAAQPEVRPISLEVPACGTMPETLIIMNDSSPSEEFFDVPEELPAQSATGVLHQDEFAYTNNEVPGDDACSFSRDANKNINKKCSEEIHTDDDSEIFQDATDSEITLNLTSHENIPTDSDYISKENLTYGALESPEGINAAKKPPPGPSQSRVTGQKPPVSRSLKDFAPFQKKEDSSIIKEETRKIIMMLGNDKACKVPRPNLGLQDRLKNLMQKSSGKKTSYIKGPRFCNTLVKSIAKCANEKLAARRDSFQDFIKQRKGGGTCDITHITSNNKSNVTVKNFLVLEENYCSPVSKEKIQSKNESSRNTFDIYSQQSGLIPTSGVTVKSSQMSWEETVGTEITKNALSISDKGNQNSEIHSDRVDVNSNNFDCTSTQKLPHELNSKGDTNRQFAEISRNSDCETQSSEISGQNENALKSNHLGISSEVEGDQISDSSKSFRIIKDEVTHYYVRSENDTPVIEPTSRVHQDENELTKELNQENGNRCSVGKADVSSGEMKFEVCNDNSNNQGFRGKTQEELFSIHTTNDHPVDQQEHEQLSKDNQIHSPAEYSPCETSEFSLKEDATVLYAKESKNLSPSNSASVSLTSNYDTVDANSPNADPSIKEKGMVKEVSLSNANNEVPDQTSTHSKEIKKQALKKRIHQQPVKKSVTNKDLQQHIASLNKVSKNLVTRQADKKQEKNTWLKNAASNILAKQSTGPKVPSQLKDKTKGSKEKGNTLSEENTELSNAHSTVSAENLDPVVLDTDMKSRNSSLTVTGDCLSDSNNTSEITVETDIIRLKTDNLVKRHRGAHFQYRIPEDLKKRKRVLSSSESDDRRKTSEPQNDSQNTFGNGDKSSIVLEPQSSQTENDKKIKISRDRYNSVDNRKLFRSKSRRSTMIRRHSCHPDGLNDSEASSVMRNSIAINFSQGMMVKCLEIAIDKCESMGWETKEEAKVYKPEQAPPQDLDEALEKAIIKRDAERVRFLLDQGADPNITVGHTPALLRAVKDGTLYIVQALVAAGADTDVRTDSGDSAVHIAARGGYAEIIFHLVQSGAHVDAIDRNGVTPLQTALAHGHLEVAQMLLRLNADILAQNKVGESALEIARYLGYVGLTGRPKEVRRDSAPGTRVEVPPSEIPVRVRMIQGLEEGDPAVVEDCLARGASPNTVVPLALHWPARAGVLHRAAHHGEDLIARLLIAAGANVNMRDVVGNTPLHAAAQAGHNRVVKVLLSNGSNLEASSQSGMTPLHRAASKGKDLTCNLLLRRGANPKAEDNNGYTPGDWARRRGFKSLARKLFHRRRSSTSLLADANIYKVNLRRLNKLHEAALKDGQQIDTMDTEE